MKAIIVTLAVAVLAAVGAESSASAATGMAGQWHLDEGSGTTVRDSTQHHDDGRIVSGASWVPGRFGSALSFNGMSGRLLVRDNLALEPASSVTVSAWIRSVASPGDYRYIVAKGASHCTTASYGLYSGPQGGLIFYVSKNHGTAFVRSSDAGTGVWDGNWHLAVGTFDGSFVRLYIDGRAIGHGTRHRGQLEYQFENSNDLFIGDYPACQPATFDGDIDEVSIWRVPLTAAQIKAAYDHATGQDTGGSGQNTAGSRPGSMPDLAPSIHHLTVSPSVFRIARGHTRRRVRTGATVSYTDTEAAMSTFTVLARRAGVRRHGRCVARPRHRRKSRAARCSYYRRVGGFTHNDVAARNRFHFGRLHGRRLTAGRYRLEATPRSNGLVGHTVRVAFTIKR